MPQIIPALIVSLAVTAASAFATYELSQHPNRQIIDNSPTILTERGSFLPRLVGRRRVNGFLVWAGKRTHTGGDGGGKGGGGGGSAIQYHQPGWQVLCVGPADSLTKIVESGKIIWEGNLTRANTPSGTHIQTDAGNAYIYWGEVYQPVDPLLAANLGISSRWPGICHVVWNKKILGGSPQWGVLEYELTVKVLHSPLPGSDAWINEQVAGDLTDGPNPAHVLWELLTAPPPWGMAIPTQYLDGAAFQSLGQLFATEHQSCHFLATDGITGVDLLGQIFQDLGIVMPQIGGVLSPIAIRKVDPNSLPTIDDTVEVLPAPPTIEVLNDSALPDRIIFTIKDRTNAFRDVDIVYDADAQPDIRSHNKPRKVSITTVIDRLTATKVADRRTQEILTNPQKLTFKVARCPRYYACGQALNLAGYGVVRIATTSIDVTDSTATFEALADQYSGDYSPYVPPDAGDGFDDPISVQPVPDTIDVIEELPYSLSTSTPSFAVLRARANDQIDGAVIYTSAAGTTYSNIGSVSGYATGGYLQTDLPASDPWIIEEGPVITAFNDDIANVLDLSGDEFSWRSGVQIAVIGGEIFFLRNLTAVGDGWRLDGLIRARYDTDAGNHIAGDVVMIAQKSEVKPFASSLIRPNASFLVKVQPLNGDLATDISTVMPVTVNVTSPRALRPLPPDNFAANRGVRINEYSSGQDIQFAWTYRVKNGNGAAAGETGAGTAISSTALPHEGTFRIRIYSGGTVLRTLTIDDDTGAKTYTNAELIADFGSEPATFTADLTDISGVYESTVRTITVTKV